MSRLPKPLTTWPLTVAALRAGGRPLLILTYHRVLHAPDPLLPSEPDVDCFRDQLRYLSRTCEVLTLPEASARLAAGTLPRRAVCITFDDGYANNERLALPVLEEFGLAATFFVATGYLDGGCMWNDAIIETVRACAADALDLRALGFGRYALGDIGMRRAAINQLINQLKYRPLVERTELVTAIAHHADVGLPDNLMMTSDQVRSLHARGMDIGGHTINHPILARIPDDEAWQEILGGRDALTRITGTEPRSFAYPNGRPGQDFGREHSTMVRKAGFSCAVTTAWGYSNADTDPWLLPRVTLWSRTPARLTANLVSIYVRRRK